MVEYAIFPHNLIVFIWNIFRKYLYKPLQKVPMVLKDLSFVKYIYVYKKWKSLDQSDIERSKVNDACQALIKPNNQFW